MKIPLVRGRFFNEQDDATHPFVFIINQTLAARLFPNQDPVGQHMSYTGAPDQPLAEIIGVVGDEKLGGVDAPATPIVYDALLQYPQSTVSLVVRTASNPDSFVPSLRTSLRDLDPQLVVSAAATLDAMIANSGPMFLRRFPAILIGCFAGLAMILSAVGIYGVIAYSVAQRTREIGIRMALGARRADILRQIIWFGMRMTFVGVAVGFAGALALTRVLGSLLFQVKSTDPLTFACVALLLSAVAFSASYAPARRATKVDPMVALRHE
jgi:putative ABC transport system permease protein